jgi:hypothetical protein
VCHDVPIIKLSEVLSYSRLDLDEDDYSKTCLSFNLEVSLFLFVKRSNARAVSNCRFPDIYFFNNVIFCCVQMFESSFLFIRVMSLFYSQSALRE